MEQELTSKGPFWLLEEGKALDSWSLKRGYCVFN